MIAATPMAMKNAAATRPDPADACLEASAPHSRV